MAYLLDTGLLIHLARDSTAFRTIDRALGLLAGDFQPVISIISQGEVLAFAYRLGWGKAKIERLGKMFHDAVVLGVDQPSIAEHFAQLQVESVKGGLNVGQNDLWIAATALEYDLDLLTFDRDFERCPRLKFIRFDDANGLELARRPAL